MKAYQSPREIFRKWATSTFTGDWLFDRIALKYLKTAHISQSDEEKQEISETLAREYKTKYRDEDDFEDLIEDIFGRVMTDISFGEEYARFEKTIESKEEVFNNTPFKVGGIDIEYKILTSIISQFASPEILEVGVANGYSSAYCFKEAAEQHGRVTQIDKPRFFSDAVPKRISPLRPIHDSKEIIHHHLLINRLAAQGKLSSKIGMGGLKKGGKIPDDKYVRWMVPSNLQKNVNNEIIIGDVFEVIDDIDEDEFDVIILDAVKQYDDRYRSYDLLNNRLSEGGICIQDGYWLNSAFKDFCEDKGYPHWTTGRIGFFKKP